MISLKSSFTMFIRKSKYNPDFILGIANIIDKHKIDLVHCTMQFSLLAGWIAGLFSTRSPAIIAAIHTTINKGLKEDIHDRLIYQWLMRRCKKLIFVCNNQQLYWQSKYSFITQKSEVIYNGVDVMHYNPQEWVSAGVRLRNELNMPDNACVFACVAGFRKEKGHQLIIEALNKINCECYLLLAGDGVCRNYITGLVESLGLSDRVHFLGMVNDVRPVLSAVNATILASTAVETFSIAMLESMSMSTPMIATDIGGMCEAIENGRTGWLVEPGNVDQLANIMQQIEKEPVAVSEMGELARLAVTEKFSIYSMTRNTENLLDEILA